MLINGGKSGIIYETTVRIGFGLDLEQRMAQQNVIDKLKERGLLKQVVYEEELKKLG